MIYRTTSIDKLEGLAIRYQARTLERHPQVTYAVRHELKTGDLDIANRLLKDYTDNEDVEWM